jgi:hypothetical protein
MTFEVDRFTSTHHESLPVFLLHRSEAKLTASYWQRKTSRTNLGCGSGNGVTTSKSRLASNQASLSSRTIRAARQDLGLMGREDDVAPS